MDAACACVYFQSRMTSMSINKAPPRAASQSPPQTAPCRSSLYRQQVMDAACSLTSCRQVDFIVCSHTSILGDILTLGRCPLSIFCSCGTPPRVFHSVSLGLLFWMARTLWSGKVDGFVLERSDINFSLATLARPVGPREPPNRF